MTTPIDAARYGELFAHVRYFPRARQAEVLRRLGETSARFEEAHRTWQEVIVSEALAEDHTETLRYATAYADTKARLKRDRPTVESLGKLVPAPTFADEETAWAPESAPADAGVAPVETDVATSPPPAPIAWPTDGRSIGEAMSDIARPPAPAVGPVTEGSSATDASPTSTETTDVPAHVFAEAALPFRGESRAAPSALETADVDFARLFRDALPFLDRHAQAGDTQVIAAANMTVEQYASFRAERIVFPERRERLRVRYGVAGEGEEAYLDATWKRRTTQDPALEARLAELERSFVTWLRKTGPFPGS